MRLRATSKQDKLLVESAPKYRFKTINFSISDYPLPRAYESEYVTDDEATYKLFSRASPENTEKTLKFVAQVAKFSTATTLLFDEHAVNLNDVCKFLANISNLATYNFRKLGIISKWFEVVEFFLKNNNHVENIQLFWAPHFGRDKMLEFVTYPSVINAGTAILSRLNNAEVPYQLITKWLEKEDLEVGKEIYFETSNIGVINILSARFASRKISDNTDKCVLISTNNPTKAIKILYDGSDYTWAIVIKVVEFNRNIKIIFS